MTDILSIQKKPRDERGHPMQKFYSLMLALRQCWPGIGCSKRTASHRVAACSPCRGIRKKYKGERMDVFISAMSLEG